LPSARDSRHHLSERAWRRPKPQERNATHDPFPGPPGGGCPPSLSCRPSLRAEPAWTFTWTSPDTSSSRTPAPAPLACFPVPVHGSGTSDIVAANLQAISTAPANTPDPFTGKGYTLNLHLVDDASGNAGDLTFTGHFDGSLSSTSVNLTHTFDQNTGTLNLGGHEYKVTLGSFNPPACLARRSWAPSAAV